MNPIVRARATALLIPDAKFEVINGEEFVWLDDRPMPTDEEIEAKIKELEEQEKIDAKYKECANYILEYYPQIKQASDQADKEYFSTILKAQGAENLEAEITTRIQNFFAGSTLEDVVANIADEDKEAYTQLVKVGIRVTWVQLCKSELRNAIAENREPVFPEYPL